MHFECIILACCSIHTSIIYKVCRNQIRVYKIGAFFKYAITPRNSVELTIFFKLYEFIWIWNTSFELMPFIYCSFVVRLRYTWSLLVRACFCLWSVSIRWNGQQWLIRIPLIGFRMRSCAYIWCTVYVEDAYSTSLIRYWRVWALILKFDAHLGGGRFLNLFFLSDFYNNPLCFIGQKLRLLFNYWFISEGLIYAFNAI